MKYFKQMAFFYVVHFMRSNMSICANDLSNLEQANGFSPVFFFKAPICENNLSHFEQANGFSPVWVLSWAFKLLLWLKVMLQLEQANGFSPVWVLSCFMK